VGDQHAGIAARLGVETDDGLAVEVLGHVGDQPVLADDHHDVLGAEDEAGQVGALDLGPPPLDRDGSADDLKGKGLDPRPAGHLVDAAAPLPQEPVSVLAGAVVGDELVVLGASVDDDSPGQERHGVPRPAPPSASPAGPAPSRAGPEPEGQAGPRVPDTAAAPVLDERRRLGPQVVEEGVVGDVGHGGVSLPAGPPRTAGHLR
jgi:hypothetical protein